MRLLESNGDAATILDLTILLLFQQVKNLIAFGSSLHDPDLLKLLTSERKISNEVAQALTTLAEALAVVDGGEEGIDTALMETVRSCGLCRDITKHQVAG